MRSLEAVADLSVKAFVQYLRTVRPKNTVYAYRHAANNLVRYVQSKKVDRRNPGLLYGFQSWLLGRGISAKTLQCMMPGAQKYLEWRRANGDLLPVYAKPDKPKIMRHPPVVLQAAAMKQYVILTSGTNEPFRTAALLYPFSGLRANEMLTLRLDQIGVDPGDPKGKRLRFNQVVGKSKTIRDVAIIDPGSKILYTYLTGWRRAVQDSPWLFPADGDWQKPYSDRTMRRRMSDIETAIGGGRLSATVLRHTWATALADAGVPLHHLAQLAGHESIQTTYRNYIGQPTAEKLEAELGKVQILQAEGKP
jgi:site-specific recombinase XerD